MRFLAPHCQGRNARRAVGNAQILLQKRRCSGAGDDLPRSVKRWDKMGSQRGNSGIEQGIYWNHHLYDMALKNAIFIVISPATLGIYRQHVPTSFGCVPMILYATGFSGTNDLLWMVAKSESPVGRWAKSAKKIP